MSPLALIKRSMQRTHRITAAQAAHLRRSKYRGIDTTAHQPPHKAYKPVKQLTYRGHTYSA